MFTCIAELRNLQILLLPVLIHVEKIRIRISWTVEETQKEHLDVSPIPGPAHDSMFPMPSASSCVSCPAASEKVVYSEAHKELILHLVLECSRAFDWKIIPR